jgi:hypothetical protein
VIVIDDQHAVGLRPFQRSCLAPGFQEPLK